MVIEAERFRPGSGTQLLQSDDPFTQQRQTTNQVVDDGDSGGPGRPRERIQIHRNHFFASRSQRFTAVSILQWHEHDIRLGDALGVDEAAIMIEAGQHRFFRGHEDARGARFFQGRPDGLFPAFGAVKNVHFQRASDQRRQPDDFARGEGCHIAIHGDNRVPGPQEQGRRGLDGRQRKGMGLFTDEVIKRFSASLGNEPMHGGDTGLHPGHQPFAGHERRVTGMAGRHVSGGGSGCFSSGHGISP